MKIRHFVQCGNSKSGWLCADRATKMQIARTLQIFTYFSAKTNPETETTVVSREKTKTDIEFKILQRPTLVKVHIVSYTSNAPSWKQREIVYSGHRSRAMRKPTPVDLPNAHFDTLIDSKVTTSTLS